MKYLIFDLEKASCFNNKFKVCEFGFVLVDENFNIIRKGNYIMSPNIKDSEWDYYALKKLLYRTKTDYNCHPTFPAYYDEIKALFKQADMVFGHTVAGDAQGINDECERYGLEPINYDFYDIKEFFKFLSGETHDVGVTKTRELLEINDEYKEHDAESDSITTMLELKVMLKKYEVSLEDLINKVPDAKDSTKDFVIDSIEKNKAKKAEKIKKYKEALARGEIGDGTNILFKLNRDPFNNKKIFLQFLDNVQPTKEGKGLFKDKKVSISLNYEYDHFRQMMNIVQMLKNEGGTYVLKGSESDVYVKFDTVDEEGKPRGCSRLKYVTEAIENGKNIEIITLDEFLAQLGTTKEELDEMPFPSLECLTREDAIIKGSKKKKNSRPKDKATKKEESQGDVHLKCNLGTMFQDVFDKIEKDIEDETASCLEDD